MPEPIPEREETLTQAQADHLCQAGSAVYYAMARAEANRTGRPVLLPDLLCPEAPPPCPCQFAAKTLEDAHTFLYRLGVIGPKQPVQGLTIEDL